MTIALTNAPASELGDAAAELVLPLEAGPEHAVAATKTYVNQLAALALLAGTCAGGRGAGGLRLAARRRGEGHPRAGGSCRRRRPTAFAFVGRMFVMGRGLEFATAREVALKLKETCRIAAEPFTATDLVHGPIAALDPLFPCGRSPSADALPAVLEASARVRAAGAAIVASGNAAAEIEDPAYTLAVPEPVIPVLSAALCPCCPASFSPALSPAPRGSIPTSREGLSKVTLAR